MRQALSPLRLVLLCWGLTGLGAATTLSRLDHLDLVQTFMMRERLSLSAFSLAGLAWLLLMLVVYVVADTAAQLTRRHLPSTQTRLSLNRAAKLTFWLNLVLLGVTMVWIASSATKAGGVFQLAAAAYADSLSTRDLLLENKLFTGMRLFYAALPATASMAAALLVKDSLSDRDRTAMRFTLTCNTIALFVLPIVMSQRLLLLQLLLSAYLAACLVRGRIFGLRRLFVGAILFFGLWIAREAITNPLIDRSALDIGVQKLAFYLVNDTWNAFAPLSIPIPHTNGGLTLEGLMFLTLSDGYFASVLEPKMAALDTVLGGGEFPFLTAAYVDFGAVGGALFVAIVAFVVRRVYIRSEGSLGWSVIYAQIGAALLFSSHSVYFTHQNFLFSLMLIGLIVALSRVRKVPGTSPVSSVPDQRFGNRVVDLSGHLIDTHTPFHSADARHGSV